MSKGKSGQGQLWPAANLVQVGQILEVIIKEIIFTILHNAFDNNESRDKHLAVYHDLLSFKKKS